MLRLFTGSAAIRAAGAVAQVLMVLTITRACGSSAAGAVFFGYSITMISSTITRAGTELSALRAIAQAHAAQDVGALRSSTVSRLLMVGTLSGAAGAIVVLGSPWLAGHSLGPAAVSPLRWAGAAIPAFALTGLLSEFYKGIGRAWTGLLVQNLATPVLVVPTILLAPTQDANAASAAICLAGSATALGALASWRRATGRWTGAGLARRRTVAALIRDMPTLLVVTATPVIMQWIGAALLGFLTTATQVAGYSVAARLAIAVSVIHSAASSVTAPRMAIAHVKGDREALSAVTMQTGLLIAAITWPILLCLAAAAPLALGVFGDGYESFAVPLRILVAGQFVAALVGHSGMVLVMTGRYVEARGLSLAAAGSLALMMGVLVPYQGARGAAIATSVSVIIGHLAGLGLVHRTTGIWTVPTSREALRRALGLGRSAPVPSTALLGHDAGSAAGSRRESE